MLIANQRLVTFPFLAVMLCFVPALGQDERRDDGKRLLPNDHQPTIVRMTAEVTDISAQADIKFREMRFGKPPLVYLSFDVILRNDQKSPRWFLLPSNLGSGHGAIGEKGGVDTLEVFSPQGKGRVVIGRFLGTGGFNAVLLPARAEVRLRQFPISYWGDPPGNLEIEIVIAKQLTIGGDRAENWFGKSPMSSVKADIAEGAENPMRVRTTKRTSDNKEVAPLIEEDRRLRLPVSLEAK